MERTKLFHPRVFDDQEWAEGYYQRNVKHIKSVGQRFVQQLKESGFQGGRVLDAGCGFGTVAIEVATHFSDADICGVDLGEPLLEMGRSLIDQAGVADRVTLVKGDVQALEFEADAFDLVLNTFMLHVVEDPVTMLNEIERVATPHARIMMTDLRRNWLGFLIKKFKTALTLEEALKMIQQSELRKGTAAKGFYWWDYMIGV